MVVITRILLFLCSVILASALCPYIPGCQICESAEGCQVCSNDFYPTGDGHCCRIEGCHKCEFDDLCLRCDQESPYSPKNAHCNACGIRNCLMCFYTIYGGVCTECKRGYFLDQKSCLSFEVKNKEGFLAQESALRCHMS